MKHAKITRTTVIAHHFGMRIAVKLKSSHFRKYPGIISHLKKKQDPYWHEHIYKDFQLAHNYANTKDLIVMNWR